MQFYNNATRDGIINKNDTEFKISEDPGLNQLLFNYSRHNLAAVRVAMGQLEERQCVRKEARPLIWYEIVGGRGVGSWEGVSQLLAGG